VVAAFLLAAAVAIAPITIRNYQIHHRLILISTNGPSTFLIGHVTHDMNLHASPDTNDADMAERHLDLSLRWLKLNWGTYLSEIPECFQIIWTGDDFWPSTSTAWSRTRDPAMARVEVYTRSPGSPPFGRATYFPDLIRYVDRLVWCLIGLPMGLLAVCFLPRRHRRWAPFYLALVPWVLIPFIAFAMPRYRMPAIPLVFVLSGQSLVACWDHRRSRPWNAEVPGERFVNHLTNVSRENLGVTPPDHRSMPG
jgi:hypothetical protein